MVPIRGFPVTLDNWQTAAQIGWTFCHIAEIFPTATIWRGAEPAAPLQRRIESVADLPCRDAGGNPSTVGAIMAATNTDGWMVVHGDDILAEEYAGAMEPATLHLLMSVSKSIVGILVGALVAEGVLDVGQQVTAYVPARAKRLQRRHVAPPARRQGSPRSGPFDYRCCESDILGLWR
jgi:CubicO group peptidase (beta-lactamase class C family)